MKIHNIMETYVTDCTNALYDEFSKAENTFLTCSCENCRLDTICYVLNRIPPKYVISGRGMRYANLTIDRQMKADIDAIVMEGMKVINASKRPYHQQRKHNHQKRTTPVFIFPIFLGAVYDGHTFEPLSDVRIELTTNGQLVAMEDASWENPTFTYKPAKGTYTFRPAPVPAMQTGLTKEFPFTITITAQGYQSLVYPFLVSATSVMEDSSLFSFKLQDSYLFPVDEINSREE